MDEFDEQDVDFITCPEEYQMTTAAISDLTDAPDGSPEELERYRLVLARRRYEAKCNETGRYRF